MNDEFRADLHCHSIFSDGSDTSSELLQLAKKNGLQGLSITDHDTIGAYTPEFFAEAGELGIGILPGVELSTQFFVEPIHILGYGFDLKSLSFQKFIETLQETRANRNLLILEKLRQKKMEVTIEEVQQASKKDAFPTKVIGRPHIAAVMIQKGYVKSIREAFQRYLGERGSCYIPTLKITPLNAIEAIHAAHGKAVLAHPHFIHKKRILKKLLTLPFDGLECYYGNLPAAQNAHFIQKAKELGWILTGGSDYHGAFKPQIALGCSSVGRETYDILG